MKKTRQPLRRMASNTIVVVLSWFLALEQTQAGEAVTASLCKMRLCEFFTPSRSTGLTDFIKVIMRFLGLTIVLVATVGIIIGGLFYIFSAGDEGKAERGKSIIIASIIGLSVVFMSYLIVTLLQTFIYTFGGV